MGLKLYLLLFILFILTACQPVDKQENNSLQLGNKDYDIAWEFYDKQENDSAYIYFNKAYPLFLRQNNKHQAAKCLINMAYVSKNQGDWFGSQELIISSLKLLNPKDEEERETMSSAFTNLGQTTHELGNYDEAIRYYQKAIDYTVDPAVIIINQNNTANSYRYNKQFNEAIKIYEALLNDKQIKESPKENARILDNLAYTKWLQNKNIDVEDEFNQALKIRKAEQDSWGQNASYAHLTDYFSEKNKAKALDYANKRKEIVFENKSIEDKLEVYQQLILLESPDNSKKYFEAYQKLNDSIQLVRNKAKNQFALVRYDSEKNKADFLRVEAENSQKQNVLLKQYIAIGLLIIGFVLAYFWYKKRKQKLEQQKELEVKNTALKYSKKVHDKVANRIYQVMSEVENKTELSKNDLLNKLESVYEISRDISYENIDENQIENFAEKLREMISSYSSDEVQLFVFGNENDLWKNVTDIAKTEVFIIIQEFLTNMKKHSEATRVILKFSQTDSKILIHYSDNGKGVSSFLPQNGLQNTGNRISNLNGQLIFETENVYGFKINVSFPKNKV